MNKDWSSEPCKCHAVYNEPQRLKDSKTVHTWWVMLNDLKFNRCWTLFRPSSSGSDVLNDAGCTCDDCDLPHHVSTRVEVRHLVEIVKTFLLEIPKPAIITIARSSRDDYCPPEDVNFIQDCVLEMLQEVYGCIEIQRDYETDNSEEEPPQSTSA
ncbi:UPF0489 protein C5orf22 homolog [Caerostris extrusa]|uniref:UPF0489 protein C5orf22 homolog n=1 Tax=Caerostris extrusa TaxID=172846 RepID=A0AAV4NAA1_CAEEX|nr:UPF0489 protein C5orf22 homolog [Caerostris extrusa]